MSNDIFLDKKKHYDSISFKFKVFLLIVVDSFFSYLMNNAFCIIVCRERMKNDVSSKNVLSGKGS